MYDNYILADTEDVMLYEKSDIGCQFLETVFVAFGYTGNKALLQII